MTGPYLNIASIVLARMAARAAKEKAYLEWKRRYKVKDDKDPRSFYDYRAAFKARVVPRRWGDLPQEERDVDIQQGRHWLTPDSYMWPDKYKKPGHPIPPERKKKRSRK